MKHKNLLYHMPNMDKKLKHLVIMKWKSRNFTAIKIHFFFKKKDMDIDNLLICNKIFSGEKKYKYFIGYVNNYHKINPLLIMLPKTSAKVMMVKLNAYFFLLEKVKLLKNMMIFGIKSA